MAHSEFGRHAQGALSIGGYDFSLYRYPTTAADLLQSLSVGGREGDGPGGDWERAWIDLGGEG